MQVNKKQRMLRDVFSQVCKDDRSGKRKHQVRSVSKALLSGVQGLPRAANIDSAFSESRVDVFLGIDWFWAKMGHVFMIFIILWEWRIHRL